MRCNSFNRHDRCSGSCGYSAARHHDHNSGSPTGYNYNKGATASNHNNQTSATSHNNNKGTPSASDHSSSG